MFDRFPLSGRSGVPEWLAIEARLHEKLVTLRYTTHVENMTLKPRCAACNPRVSTRVIQSVVAESCHAMFMLSFQVVIENETTMHL